MSKRNFILLIIVLILAVAIVFGFFYFRMGTTPGTGGDTGGINFLSRFNPFAKSAPPPAKGTTPTTDIPNTEPTTGTTAVVVMLKKISSMPVAGYGVYMKERLKEVPAVAPTASSLEATTPATSVDTKKTPVPKAKPTPPPTEFATALRYVERATGNIYQTFADKIEETKFSTTIIPKIYEASFLNSAASVVMRYLKPDGQTIETFLGNLPKEVLGGDTTGDNEIKGSFLPENISDLSISADGTKVFYLFNVGDNAIGTTLNLSDNKKVQVFDSPFTEWLSFWPKNGMITLTTKPSASIPGYMYTINTDKKTLNMTLGGISGLTTLTSPNGKLILYGDNNLSLYIYHTDTRNSDLLGVRTLPEKCIWGSASDTLYCAVPRSITPAEYPDAWYKGEVSFSDQLWKVDATTGQTAIISDPVVVAGEEVDSTKLYLDAEESYLFFVNKKDSFLWELQLK